MVMNDEGQLYTIEGITAGIIMLLTAYVVFSTGFVFTPGDAHIADMQLQQLGYDALLVMDTPDRYGEISLLEKQVASYDHEGFTTKFNDLLLNGTGSTVMVDSIRWNATMYYRNYNPITGVSEVHSLQFGPDLSVIPLDQRKNYDLVTREQAISVTRYVEVSWKNLESDWPDKPNEYKNVLDNVASEKKQIVMLEILLWRG